jgi:hypothetical protein
MGNPPTEKQATDAAEPITHVLSNEELGSVEKLPDRLHTDIGLELYREALLMDPAEREAIAKRVKVKLDCILLPMVNHPHIPGNPCVYILLVVFYILLQLPRQADSGLRQYLWSESRSRSRRPGLLLGSFNHQHRISRLCLSLYPPSPETPNWKIRIWKFDALGRDPHTHNSGP